MGQVVLEGSITGGPPSASANSVPSSSVNVSLFLQGGAKQFGSSTGTIQRTISSPGAFVALSAIGAADDVPKSDFFYLNVNGNLDVEITADDGNGGSTVVVVSTSGPFLIVPSSNKLITGVRVKGSGQIEYFASGP